MAINAEKLVNYAAHSISNVKIAQALGITEARVSQLLADDRIIAAVEKRKQVIAEENITDAADLRTISSKLISRMLDLAEDVDSLSEATNVLEKVDKLTNQKLGKEDTSSGVKTILIQVPVFVQQSLHTVERNRANQIESINGRSMAPMPTANVMKLLRAKEVKNEDPTEDNFFDSLETSGVFST